MAAAPSRGPSPQFLSSITQKMERNAKFIFLVPTIVFLIVLGVFPLLFSLYMLFGKWQGGTISWVGLENIERLVRQDRFWNSVQLTVLFVILATFAELVLGPVVALSLQSAVVAKNWLRLLFTLPMLLPPIAVSFAWKMLFDYNRGPVNHVLDSIGLGRVEWVGNPSEFLGVSVPLLSVVLIDVWQWTPFVALGMLAALESLSPDLYEAATIDGAGVGAMLRDITFPMIAPYVVALIALRSIDAFKIVDTITVLTGGGPGTATEVLTFYGYVAGYRTFNLGFTSAVAWALVIIMTVVFMVLLRVLRRPEEG
jgi:multiple sugar transport system permease protein